jgi:glycine/D-amino acid oxidase-like deaminating enzyme
LVLDNHDVVIAGGGVVGCALAYGLLARGRRVIVLDGSDVDARAARGNFGLVGAFGKGDGAPYYQRLSLDGVALWPAFARALKEETDIDVEYENDGCLNFCLGEEEFSRRTDDVARWNAQMPNLPAYARMIVRAELERRLPEAHLGPKVCGAGIGSGDGHCNPLKLLRALQQAIVLRGGTLVGNHRVSKINPHSDGTFEVNAQTPGGTRSFHSQQLVIAAGLGSAGLSRMVGMDVPLRPQRGQLLVTERLQPTLRLPASGIRQTRDGTIMIGVSVEEVGMDLGTSTSVAARMTRRALAILPELASVRLVRHWSSLRIITPDEYPIYAESAEYPGAFVAVCHSGITLAAFHAATLASALAQRKLPPGFEIFHNRRFDVSQVI